MSEKVGIIILNWNKWEDTIECLESVYRIDYPDYEVIVVDNDSKNNSVEKIKEYGEGKIKIESKFFKYNHENKPVKFFEITKEETEKNSRIDEEFKNSSSNKKLTLIKNPENLGFTGGNNVGIKFALKIGCRFILLLNNDVVIEPDILKKFLNNWEKLEKPGALSGVIYYYDFPYEIWFGGAKWNWWKMNFDVNENSIQKAIKTDYICGACIFTEKEVLKKIGLFDERFFLLWEDTDWSYSARKKVYNLYILPEVKVFHKIGQTFGSHKTLLYQYYITRNHKLFLYKHFNLIHRFSTSNIVTFYVISYLIIAKAGLTRRQIFKKEKIEVTNEEIKGKLYGLKDYFLKKFGKCRYQNE